MLSECFYGWQKGKRHSLAFICVESLKGLSAMKVVRPARTLLSLRHLVWGQFPLALITPCHILSTPNSASMRQHRGCLFPRAAILCITPLLALAVLPQASEAKSNQVLKVKVRFLATGTLTRGTCGSNQDQYLVEVAETPESEPILARLIDEYAPYQFPLSYDTLTSQSGLVMKIRRDSRCEIPYASMPLRTAPGDPLATVHESGYHPQLSKTPKPDAVLPCYRPERPRGGF